MIPVDLDWARALRKQLKAGLISARTVAGARVESERTDPVAVHPSEAAAVFPLICAYVLGESAAAASGGTVYSVEATIRIDVWTSGVSDASLSAEEIVGESRDLGIAQVLAATVLNPRWRAQFEKVPTYAVKRGAAANHAALVLGAGQIEIAVVFRQGLVLRPPEEIFETFAIEARVSPAPADAAADTTLIAQLPQEAP